MAKIIIKKFDAIRAQLDAAIELYFISDNIIATHTLTAAAYNLLRDISKKNDSEFPFLKSGFLGTLSQIERKQMIQFINEAENFFKHAVNDPDDFLSFDPELTEILLIDACAYFYNTNIQKPKNYKVFRAWVGKIKSDIPLDKHSTLFLENSLQALKARGKKQFWEDFNEHLSKKNFYPAPHTPPE